MVLVAPDTDVDEPIHVVHLSGPGDAPTVSHPRTVIEVGAGSRLTVIETYAGLPGRGLTNAATDDRRRLRTPRVTHYKVQTEAAERVHVAHTHDPPSRRLRGALVLGHARRRHRPQRRSTSYSAAPTRRVELDGLYLPTGTQRHDNVITVEHAASRVYEPPAVQGRGRRPRPRVVQRPDHRAARHRRHRRRTRRAEACCCARPLRPTPARGSRSSPTTCAAPTAPPSARLDDEALFYLRTRGIPERDARTMLIAAFIDEMTAAIQPDALRAAPRNSHRRDGTANERRAPMTSEVHVPVELTGHCVATTVPGGDLVTLPAGARVAIVQPLGGSITVRTERGRCCASTAATPMRSDSSRRADGDGRRVRSVHHGAGHRRACAPCTTPRSR